MAPKLSAQARRLRTIIVTVPIMAATSFVLYKRLVLGEPQRTLPRTETVYSPRGDGDVEDRRIVPLRKITVNLSLGAGSTDGGDEEALIKVGSDGSSDGPTAEH
ncbi:uncharacterized protein C8Q71DRAFT_126107 [Rhodofomes roseus]|uniref:Uncharacterized protein n=1 Tax=Rhodofomes roseus TaxID=34475 RepID=A0ABQ8KBC8_9APHY|nr:uncharacterized protein C8Q71DRAFT_126107 [Rhodofomes roseus]KAH9834813.1 hypothetical protein C8Q71DRAFT_126107 [Rhodofomes roseus]